MVRKVCKNCDLIYEGDKCPNCGSQEYTEEVKGRLAIINPEKSQVAKKINKDKEGTYAIKAE